MTVGIKALFSFLGLSPLEIRPDSSHDALGPDRPREHRLDASAELSLEGVLIALSRARRGRAERSVVDRGQQATGLIDDADTSGLKGLYRG